MKNSRCFISSLFVLPFPGHHHGDDDEDIYDDTYDNFNVYDDDLGPA